MNHVELKRGFEAAARAHGCIPERFLDEAGNVLLPASTVSSTGECSWADCRWNPEYFGETPQTLGGAELIGGLVRRSNVPIPDSRGAT